MVTKLLEAKLRGISLGWVECVPSLIECDVRCYLDFPSIVISVVHIT
jgi:hypothetical protein